MIPEVHVSDGQVQELLNRLAEAEETLRAIRHGEVDGLVVQTPHGERVFTLKGAEQPYRVMVEAMEEGAATLSANGLILYCNPRFAFMLRAPHEHVQGDAITDFLAPGSHAEFGRLLAGSRWESMRGEVELLAADGTRVPVSLACSALPTSEIESICLVATELTTRKAAEAEIRQLNQELEARVEARTAELARANAALRTEIAERKQAEQERERLLEENQLQRQFLEQLMLAAPIGIAVARSPEHRLDYINPAYQAIPGGDSRPMIGRPLAEVFPILIDMGVIASLDHILATGETVSFRSVEANVGPGRERTYWDVDEVPILDADGQVESILLLTREVTERKRAEQERERLLAEVERRAAELDSVINSSTDAILLYDTDNNVVLMNPAAEDLYGMTLADFQATTCEERRDLFRIETLDGKPYPSEVMPNAFALRGEVVHGALAVMHCPEGRTVWITASAGPVRTADGRIVGAVVSITDVSKLHEMQEQQRTLLHLVSHDLRIPLAIVNGHAELVQERFGPRADDTPVADSLDSIRRGIRRMNTMIEDLTDLARLEGKQFQLNREPVALGPCLESLLAQASTVLDVQRVCLDLPEDLPLVLADGDRLHRIVTNLLSNALKYSEAGTPVLVSVSHREHEVVVSVIDQGRGIATDDLPHLFERFYRARGERRAEGIGLGLYITRLLVEAHAVPAPDREAMVGGRIWVESEPGSGSVFHFSLPVVSSQG
ncbi:MAG: PAS domain-containing sensor histidine kinase [Armatimonadota bacterium]